MNDAVSHALYGRGLEPDGLSRMVAISGGVHIVLLAVLAFMPTTWFHASPLDEPRNVMEISMGGAPGPTTQGMTPISGRAVQKAVAEVPKVPSIRPPAARTPEMVEPVKTVKPAVKPPPTPVKDAPKDAKSRTPTQGAETREGRALAETGSQANTLGLTTGGGGTGGQINLGDFCCPQYVAEMVRLIRESWNQQQQTTGTTILKFTIQRDGSVVNLGVEKTSGFSTLDYFAQRAMMTVKLPPLPPEYTNPSLTVNLAFDYHR